MIQKRTVALMLAYVLVAATCLLAQNAPQKPAPAESAKPEKKLVLTDAVRVSTKEAVTSAAEREAKKGTSDVKPKESPSDAVTEFRVADPGTTSNSNTVVTKEKSSARQIHGEIKGGLGTMGSEESGKVGTNSKSGKTSIYVETDHARTTTSP
jgi:hypothetical protein